MVNWKTADATDRLVAALIAAHPTLKLEYQAMALMFGQGATYDAIEGRFRRYRKMAEDLKAEARSHGITELPRGRGAGNSAASTPRTPRGPRNGVTKPASSGKNRKNGFSHSFSSPSKRGKKNGMSPIDAIFLDDDNECDSDVPIFIPKPEHRVYVKDEILEGIPNHDLEILEAPTSASSVASTTITSKVETPENISSFTSTFGGVKIDGSPAVSSSLQTPGAVEILNERISHVADFVDGVPGSAGRASLNPTTINHDVFDIPSFFYENPPSYDVDDIYGGAA